MSIGTQQINLYQPVLDTGKGPFSLGTSFLLLTLVAGCLVSVWGYGLWRVQCLEKAVSQLRLQQERQTQTLAALSTARGSGATPEQLEARVKTLSAQLASHSRVLELVRNGGVGQTAGFSAALSALARHPLEGLWIDRINLTGIGQPKMSLAGIALDPQLVPRYLHGLGTEQALAGVRFNEFTIERSSAASASLPETTPRESSVGLEREFIFKADSESTRVPEKDRRS